MSASQVLHVLSYERRDAAENMAVDMWMLDEMGGAGHWACRFYGWTAPAFTFGYSQHRDAVVGEVERLGRGEAAMALVRRPTGGGIVDHRHDFTYALVIPACAPEHRTAATLVYRRTHEAVRSALQACGVETQLEPCPRAQCDTTTPPDALPDPLPPARVQSLCFAAPEVYDVVLASGEKAAGAAMKRSRHGLLIQGSLDLQRLPTLQELNHSNLCLALQTALCEEFDLTARPHPAPPPAAWAATAATFASPEWNHRR